ncbi:hypothetical protein AA309_18040 [Microvirga vignae]|uniref:Uncharacterized protein n=1 Tax=Microvirga vignae TaxID=1225564 RepID=A0A0H1R9A3_9HYPH|nr:hypothetical protein AA309_18040 [Microvirga vignae]
MPVERAHVSVENVIADQVAVSFNKGQISKSENTAAQIRSRITDRFQHVKPGSEQDNAPRQFLLCASASSKRSRLLKLLLRPRTVPSGSPFSRTLLRSFAARQQALQGKAARSLCM